MSLGLVRRVRAGWYRRLIASGLLAFIAALMLPLGFATAAPPAQSSGSITILPINKARLLAGQRFDLRVEVSGLAQNTNPNTINVQINGTPLATFFAGKPISATNTISTSAELTVRQVAFTTAGTYTVTASIGDKSASVAYTVVAPQNRKAKNVILFIGDGMSWGSVTTARIVSRGLTQGRFNGMLEMEQMPYNGYVTTSGYDSLVTDSANSASAYSTGHKGVVNAMGTYADNTANTSDDPRVETIIELVQRARNMAAGVVTTAEIEDATPAAMWAHTRRRSDYQTIIDQLLQVKPEVVMGGGSAYFIPKSTAGSKRTDERNIFNEFQALGYSLAGTRAEMNAVTTTATTKVLGLFHPGNMNVWVDREMTKDPAVLGPYTNQPTLYEMTQKALDVLSNSQKGKDNGFFLMVEGASIDKMFHPLDWERGIGDIIEMDRAIAVAKQFAAKNNDTLIVVTADHAHSFSVYGTYDTSKGPGNISAVGTYANSILPTFVDKNNDSFPDSFVVSRTLVIGFGNHPAYREDFLFNPQPQSPTIQDNTITSTTVFTVNPARDPQGVFYAANLPATEAVGVHSADDVPLWASGPGAEYFTGIHDNTSLFFGMVGALGIDPTGTQAGRYRVVFAIILGITFAVGAGHYLRRPGTGDASLTSAIANRLRKLRAATTAARKSFRERMSEDDTQA